MQSAADFFVNLHANLAEANLGVFLGLIKRLRLRLHRLVDWLHVVDCVMLALRLQFHFHSYSRFYVEEMVLHLFLIKRWIISQYFVVLLQVLVSYVGFHVASLGRKG